MNDKDNVTPITPDIPDIEGYKRIEGQYTGAADAVHRVLKDHGFDDQAKNRGWIELTIVARFSDEGAMFHTVQAKGIAMGLAAPGLTLLRMMALANDLPRDYFVLIATVNELNILDKELHSITPEQAEALVDGDEDEQAGVVSVLNCQASDAALKAIFQRGKV